MSTRFFGQYLLEKGRINSQQLLTALEFQKTILMPIRVMAMERGWLGAAQIKELLELQKSKPLRFGELAVTSGYLTQAQVDELPQVQESSHRVRLGEALVVKGFITMEVLARERKEYNKESEKFAAEVSSAFGALAHQDIVIERCESGK